MIQINDGLGRVAPASVTSFAALQPPDNLVVNAMDLGGEVLVGELRSTVADDDITIGEGVGIEIGHQVASVFAPSVS